MLQVALLARKLGISNTRLLSSARFAGVTRQLGITSSLTDEEAGSITAYIKLRTPLNTAVPGISIIKAGAMADASYPRGQTAELSQDQPLVVLPEGGVPWHFDDSGYYSYLLITAEEQVRRAVLEGLRASRFGTTTGPSQRPANNRIQYSHYIRVTKSAIAGKVKFEAVEGVLLSILGPSAKPSPIALRPIPRVVLPLPHKPGLAQKEPASTLHEELNAIRQALKQMTEDRDLHRSLLEIQSDESEVEQFRNEVKNLRKRIQDLRSENEIVGIERDRAYENLRDLQEWANEQAAGAAIAVESPNVQPADQPDAGDDLLGAVLKHLLRRVELHPGALSQLQNEIERPERVISILAALNYGEDVDWDKSIKGALGWREKKFTKHKSTDGRLYAIFRADASVPWLVYLSDKHNQRTDIARLRELI